MLIVMQRARPSDDPTTAQVLNSINQHLMTISARLTSIETRVANLEGRVLKLETGGQVLALETGPVPQSVPARPFGVAKTPQLRSRPFSQVFSKK